MALFRRATPKGRHALGAAVTSIPSGPPAALSLAAYLPPAAQREPEPALLPEPPMPALPEPAGEPSVLASIAELIATGEAWATDVEDFHALRAPAPVAAAAQPVVVVERVQAPVAETPAAPVIAVDVPTAPASVPAFEAPVVPAPAAPSPIPPSPALPVAAPMPAAPVPAATVTAPAAAVPLPPLPAPLAPPQPLAAPQTAPVIALPVPPTPAPAPPTPDSFQPSVEAAPLASPPQPTPSGRVALEAALVDLLPQQGGEPPAAPPVQAPPRRVQLGFRDGSSATLDPGSSQYQALEELAQSLTRRD